MKTVCLIVGWLLCACAFVPAQVPAKKALTRQDSLQLQGNKPELFTSGFIDIINNGQVNASAKFVKLYIGETTPAFPLILIIGLGSSGEKPSSAVAFIEKPVCTLRALAKVLFFICAKAGTATQLKKKIK